MYLSNGSFHNRGFAVILSLLSRDLMNRAAHLLDGVHPLVRFTLTDASLKRADGWALPLDLFAVFGGLIKDFSRSSWRS